MIGCIVFLYIFVFREDDIVHALQKSLDYIDVLITTGSVSMGDKDLLKPVIEKYFNATIHFGKYTSLMKNL